MAWTPNLGAQQISVGTPQPHVQFNEGALVLAQAVRSDLALDLSGTPNIELTQTQSTNAIIAVTATTAPSTITVRAALKTWTLINDGTHDVTVQTAGQSSPPSVAAGARAFLVCDGTSVRAA